MTPVAYETDDGTLILKNASGGYRTYWYIRRPQFEKSYWSGTEWSEYQNAEYATAEDALKAWENIPK